MRVSDTLINRRCRCNVQPVLIVRVVDCNEDRTNWKSKNIDEWQIQLVDSLKH